MGRRQQLEKERRAQSLAERAANDPELTKYMKEADIHQKARLQQMLAQQAQMDQRDTMIRMFISKLAKDLFQREISGLPMSEVGQVIDVEDEDGKPTPEEESAIVALEDKLLHMAHGSIFCALTFAEANNMVPSRVERAAIHEAQRKARQEEEEKRRKEQEEKQRGETEGGIALP